MHEALDAGRPGGGEQTLGAGDVVPKVLCGRPRPRHATGAVNDRAHAVDCPRDRIVVAELAHGALVAGEREIQIRAHEHAGAHALRPQLRDDVTAEEASAAGYEDDGAVRPGGTGRRHTDRTYHGRVPRR